jgi:hypothetical protein
MDAELRPLLLSAALDRSQRGLEAWRSLLERTPFDVIDGSTTRLLPRIYLTLREHGSSVPELGRLKGAYRSTWAHTSLLVSAAMPVLAELSERRIRFRLVKGAAIGALDGRWGARTMGDVDLLVGPEGVDAVAESLRRHRFAPTFGRSVRSGTVDGGWRDATSGSIDVHAVRARQRDLLGMVLRAPARVGRLATGVVPIPPPELMLLHAVAHGRAAVATTDSVQSSVDVALLIARCEPARLRAAARVLGMVPALAEVLADLDSLGIPLPQSAHGLRLVARSDRIRAAEVKAVSAAQFAVRARELPGLVAGRWPGGADVSRARRIGVGYAAWLAAGQLRPLESVLVRRHGGLLEAPVRSLRVGESVTVRVDATQASRDEGRVSVGPAPQTDLRVRVRIDASAVDAQGVVALQLACEPSGAEPRLVYAGGRLVGSVPVLGDQPARIEVPVESAGVELSLRRLGRGGGADDLAALVIVVLDPRRTGP